jgi:hypothetical protein
MLSYTDKSRIYQEVIVGAIPPDDEPTDAKEWRDTLTKSVAEAQEQGFTPDLDLDWEGE